MRGRFFQKRLIWLIELVLLLFVTGNRFQAAAFIQSGTAWTDQFNGNPFVPCLVAYVIAGGILFKFKLTSGFTTSGIFSIRVSLVSRPKAFASLCAKCLMKK